MELHEVQGVWKDTKGRCLIRIIRLVEPILLGTDKVFYADIDIVKGSFYDATSYYESVLPKRSGVSLQIKGEQRVSTIEQIREGKRVVKCVFTNLYSGVSGGPANRSRSG
jgi:hypothetical protein